MHKDGRFRVGDDASRRLTIEDFTRIDVTIPDTRLMDPAPAAPVEPALDEAAPVQPDSVAAPFQPHSVAPQVVEHGQPPKEQGRHSGRQRKRSREEDSQPDDERASTDKRPAYACAHFCC